MGRKRTRSILLAVLMTALKLVLACNSVSLPLESTPTEVRQPTAGPTVAFPTPSPELGIAPDLVWLRYGWGSYTDLPSILVVRDSIPAYETSPVPIVHFWGFSTSGRIAYSTAVRDLWVYDYGTGETEMWLPGDVQMASWSPTIDSEGKMEHLGVVVSDETGHHDLIVLSEPDQMVATIEHATHFSWSPDGQWLAFLRWCPTGCNLTDEGLYVASADGREPTRIGPLLRIGYIYERPIWAQECQAIIYNDGRGFRVALVDGSDSFHPTTPELESLTVAGRRYVLWSDDGMLWSPQQRQMIVLEINEMEHAPFR